MGTLVASGVLGKDDSGHTGMFFAFPDLSCRSYGRFRLRFSFMMIDPSSAALGSTSSVTCHAISNVFEVFSAKEFVSLPNTAPNLSVRTVTNEASQPGMIASTPLTHALRRQGVNIPAKKGKQTRTSKDSPDGDSDEDDDEHEQQSEPSAKGKGPARR